MKKKVCSSSLAIRFYKCHGWVIQDLLPYLLSGTIVDTEILHKDLPEIAYFYYDMHSKVDVDKLYENEVSEFHRAFDDYPEQTDLEFMKSHIG